jgi:hypothetical protein
MRETRHTGDSSAVRVQVGAWVAKSFGPCALLVIALSSVACQPGIGDSCTDALNCSTSGSRICDLTQPHGYCTLAGCDEGTCPDEAVCVKFWPNVAMQSDIDRLSSNYCMLKCNSHSDCRDDYECLSTTQFGAMDEAQVLGNPKQRFCAVSRHPVPIDAGPPPIDAAANMSLED